MFKNVGSYFKKNFKDEKLKRQNGVQFDTTGTCLTELPKKEEEDHYEEEIAKDLEK